MPRTREEGNAPLAGLVLVGGQSTRMGRDKSGLVYHGIPEWKRVRDLLSQVCGRVLISVSEDQRGAFSGEEVVVDRWEKIGPMGGVASALLECEGAAVLAVACDMPGLDDATVSALVDARDVTAEATVMVNALGQLEPLCAVYEPGVLARLVGAIDAGDYSLNRALGEARVRRVDAPSGDALVNVNTPAEAAQHGVDGVESVDGSDT